MYLWEYDLEIISLPVQYARTVLRKNSVFLRGIAEWNNLPTNIRCKPRAISFQNNLCKYNFKPTCIFIFVN